MSRRLRTGLLVGLCACVVMATAAVIIVDALSRRPFRMTVRPLGGHAVVQFAQPDRKLVSPEFPVDLVAERTTSIDLRSDDIKLPGCRVKFRDTTLLPGRFRLSVGRTDFDL